MNREEIWDALYIYNRQILSYMAGQQSLTKVEKLLLKTSEEFLWLMESAISEQKVSSKPKLTVVLGGKQ